MQYKQFGNTGMQVSRYGLGTMTFPNRLNFEASRRIVDEVAELTGDWFVEHLGKGMS